MIVCWSVKGGSGTTVVAAALALVLAQRHEAGARLIDMSGDTPSALGMSEPASEGIAEWLSATDHPGADALNNLMLPVTAHLGVIPRGRNISHDNTPDNTHAHPTRHYRFPRRDCPRCALGFFTRIVVCAMQ